MSLPAADDLFRPTLAQQQAVENERADAGKAVRAVPDASALCTLLGKSTTLLPLAAVFS